ncbi:hypothetical protein Cgig2_032075 [Carnegiea gigantea]|uniref:Uncharacterized protein n=1 Tax=Carnegiea gigantea TaxID=171969 RepID=A0A9Q1JZ99_9CARY|nr:hypothetical protein Cgig2_032075 [Carnegiea gigantea]
MKVASCFLLFGSWYPKGISDWLTLVPVRNVSPARLSVSEEKVAVVEGRPVDCNTLVGGSFIITSDSGITKVYSAGRRYCFSRAVLFKVGTTFRLGKWLLGPSCGFEQARAPENFVPSATISGIGSTGARPLFLSMDLPGVIGLSWGEELVDAPSEDELLDSLSEEREGVPSEEELVFMDTTSAAGPEELGTKRGLPSMVPSASNSSGDLIIGVDLIFAILRTWKSVIKSAKVISHGYETAASMLRMLGVDEYSQLDHEKVPA